MIRDNLGTQAVVHTLYAHPSPAQVFYHTDLQEEAHAHMMKTEYNEETPRYRKQALSIDKQNANHLWQEAMDIEITALRKRRTWKLVPISRVRKMGKKIIPSIWSFKVKYKNGTFEKCKARGCADGRRQVKGQDYNESFSPTTKLTSVRMTLALAIENDMMSHHDDIENAFLYGEIEEGYAIYMMPLEGYEERDPKTGELMVCQLIKGLYRLVQAALLFNIKLVEFFLNEGFRQCIKDPCIFVKKNTDCHIIVPVHVDDVMPTVSRKGQWTHSRTTWPRHLSPRSWETRSGILQYLSLEHPTRYS